MFASGYCLFTVRAGCTEERPAYTVCHPAPRPLPSPMRTLEVGVWGRGAHRKRWEISMLLRASKCRMECPAGWLGAWVRGGRCWNDLVWEGAGKWGARQVRGGPRGGQLKG